MATSHVLSALHKKRARMAGEIEAAERAIAKRHEGLATLDAVIAMFSPECRPDMIPSVRPYLRGLYFGYRELARLGLDAMREARGPITLARIVVYVIVAKGLPDDTGLRRHISDTTRAMLLRLAARGLVRKVVAAPETWWELTERWP